jgi:hypothetical protein
MDSIDRKIQRIIKHIKNTFAEHDLERCIDSGNVDEFGLFGKDIEKFYEFQVIVLNSLRESYIDMLLCLMRIKPSLCDLESTYSVESSGFYFNQEKDLVLFNDR